MAEKTGRTSALEALYKVEVAGSRADVALDQTSAAINSDIREKALAKELCYGVLRWRLRLDYHLNQFYRGNLDQLSPWIRNILRLGAYQLLFLNRVPEWAAVDESVKLARRFGHRGTAGLVNGVLRNMCRNGNGITFPSPDESPQQSISVKFAHPEWLVNRWVAEYGVDKTYEICKAYNQTPPLTVRANLLRTTPSRLAESLKSEGLEVVPCKYAEQGLKLSGGGSPAELNAFRKGLFQVQDEASMLATQLMAPDEGMRILDCCAGLGGKATYMAEAMHNKGVVLALDVNHRRLHQLKENCRRLGIDIIHAAVVDSSTISTLSEPFDAVIIDAPCSSLGVLHRHPEIKWKREDNDLRRLQKIQLKILDNAARFVKPGGVMVYSTCTVEPEENQDVVNEFLASHEDFRLENATPYLPEKAKKFVTGKGFLFTFPDREDMDGFFAARIRKNLRGSGVATRS